MWKAATHINSHLARVEVINVEGHIETSAVVLLNFKKVIFVCVRDLDTDILTMQGSNSGLFRTRMRPGG